MLATDPITSIVWYYGMHMYVASYVDTLWLHLVAQLATNSTNSSLDVIFTSYPFLPTATLILLFMSPIPLLRSYTLSKNQCPREKS